MPDNIKETLEQRRLAANGATFKLLRDELLERYKEGERNFSLANLYGADLSSANLYSANLSGANLYNADLSSADLSSANLYGANLYGANLYSANLSGANLYGANLYSANLSGANLYGAKFVASISGVGNSRRVIWAYRRKEDKVIIVRAGCREEPAKDVIKAIQNDYGVKKVRGKYQGNAIGINYIKAVEVIAESVELQYAEYEGT